MTRAIYLRRIPALVEWILVCCAVGLTWRYFWLAVNRGVIKKWIRANLATIETIERKMYNRHDFWGNLRLALTRVPRIPYQE